MNRIVFIVGFIALLARSSADEPRIARFDVARVFEQYQHTKDIESATSDKRHSRLPSEANAARERYEAAKKRVEEARTANDHTERAELQLQLATLNAQYIELQLTVERTKREQALQDEARRQRAEILDEIRAAAERLRGERGYLIFVAANYPTDTLFPLIFVSDTTDDLTEPLLAHLNKEYAARKSK